MVGLREGTHTLSRGLCLSYWVKQEAKACLGHSAIWLALKEKVAAYSSLLQPGLCYSFLKPLSFLSLALWSLGTIRQLRKMSASPPLPFLS